MNEEKKTYPVNIRGELTIPPSGGLWLVKWLLMVPHLFVLFFLYIAFVVVCIIAFFAILFTGKYPKSLFEFNTGVLRWSWRVWFYGYEALGTDKYPPFSLDPDPDYPADLEIAYPEKLSSGLVLVKWWLLAIPHYIIVAILTRGLGGWPFWGWDPGTEKWHASNWSTWGSCPALPEGWHVSSWLTWGSCPALPEGWQMSGDGVGLIFILAIFAGIALLFTGKYPKEIFKLVVGFNRWVYRVTAYVTLMTDKYPPFRLWDD